MDMKIVIIKIANLPDTYLRYERITMEPSLA
jgi:hypothetical protein